MYHYSRDQQEKQLSNSIELYASVLTRLVNRAELCYGYAKGDGQATEAHWEALKRHDANATLITDAALAEVNSLSNISDEGKAALGKLGAHNLDELDELAETSLSQPSMAVGELGAHNLDELDELAETSLSQSNIIDRLIAKINKFQEILQKVKREPAEMAKLNIEIKHEIEGCKRLMDDFKESAEWQSVEKLAGIKLLSDVLDKGQALGSEPASAERKGPRR